MEEKTHSLTSDTTSQSQSLNYHFSNYPYPADHNMSDLHKEQNVYSYRINDGGRDIFSNAYNHSIATSRQRYRSASRSRSRSPPMMHRNGRSTSRSRSDRFRRQDEDRSHLRRQYLPHEASPLGSYRHRYAHDSQSPSARRPRSPHSPRAAYAPRPESRPTQGYGGKPNCRVYIGNLSYDCKWHHLKDFAEEAGTVVHADVLMTTSGRSKGCGIVEYTRPEYAKRAICELNNVEFMGRPVYVREDRENDPSFKDPRDASEGSRLFVGNLSFSSSWQDLKDLFRQAGRVLHTDVHTDPATRHPNGTGLVVFEDAETAQKAIDLFHGYEWRGRRLHVCEERNAPPPSVFSVQETRAREPKHEKPEPRDHRASGYQPVYPKSVPPAAAFEHRNVNGGHYIPPPPPPPPFYSHCIGLVGGPDAQTESHGPNQIYVDNLPYATTWQDLIELFRLVAPVLRAEILTTNGLPKGAGLVRFKEQRMCELAIEKFDGYVYGGRQLDIRLDKFSTQA